MTKQKTLTVGLTIEKENRGDRWAFHAPELGFTVYSETEEDGNAAFNAALVTLMNSFQGDQARMTEFLTSRSVLHEFKTREETGAPNEFNRKNMLMTVPISI